MKILHLLSQTHLTGPEVYVATLAKRQRADGNSVYIVSDTLTTAIDATYIPMPIHNRSYLNRLRNIVRLIRLCRHEHIDVIHAHSRAASWIANIVTKFCDVTYVSTMHGRQSVHASSKRGNVYGDHIIAICEHLVEHMRYELNIRDATIHVIRNGIE